MKITLRNTATLGAAVAALALSAHQAQAQTITFYNFSNATAAAAGTTVLQTEGSSTVSGFTSDLANTIPAGTSTVGSFFGTTPESGTNLSFSIVPGTASTHYFQFETLVPTAAATNAGLILSYATYRSGTGPLLQTITASTDPTFTGGVTSVIAPVGTFALTAATTYSLASFSLTNFALASDTTPVYFRITASGGTGTGGTNRVDNVFVGTPAAAPEPSSVAAMLIGSLVLGGLVMARRRSSVIA